MREIKFRAWWQDDKWQPDGKMYMVAGLHNISDSDDREPEVGISTEVQEVFIVDSLPAVQKVNWNDAKNMKLMQYTGLNDKNGKEIYEGDILTGKNHEHFDEIAEVQWDYVQWYPLAGHRAFDEYEVIGNIHENPELLNPEEN